MSKKETSVHSKWYSEENAAACKKLEKRITKEFKDVNYLDLNRIDGIPSVEFGFRNESPVLTPARILALGERLKKVVGDLPVKYQQSRSRDVTFLVLSELIWDRGEPFSEEQRSEYGTEIKDIEASWTAIPDASAVTAESRNAILQEAIDALPVGSIREADAIRALMTK